jgi:hypothetical protein
LNQFQTLIILEEKNKWNILANRDCSNPVEIKEVSILGVLKKYRTYMRGDEPYFVVQCNEGYTNDAKNDV